MKKETIASLQMLLCASLWSISGLFIKLIPWNSLAISGIRSLIAGITIYIYIAAKHYKIIINRRTLLAALIIGSTYTCFVIANKLTTGANATLLQFTSPIFIVIFSALFFGARFSRRDLIAIACTFAGIALFFFDKLESGYLLGNAVAIVSGALMAGMYIVTGNRGDEERFSTLLLGQLAAFLIGLPFIITTKPELSPLPVLYIFILGVFQLGIPYVLYGMATRYCPPLACNLLGAVEPLLNPVWVFIYDGEMPGALALIGGVLVIASVTAWSITGNKNGEVKKDASAAP